MGELGRLGDMHVAVKGVLCVQTVSVFGSMVVSAEDGVGFPALPVEIRMVSAEAAAFGVWFVRLEVLIGGSEGGIQ